MQYANRLNDLGTETAYAVSGEAAVHKAKGNTVFPYHIGDLNFPTAPSVIRAVKEAIDAGKTGYNPALGIKPLRDAVAKKIGEERGLTYSGNNVSVQPGGKPVIEKFLLASMNEGDEVLYPSPGYPIYESLINFYGGVPVPYTYKETKDGSLVLDLPALTAKVSSKTRVLIYNNMHNPTGHQSSPEEMAAIAQLCVKHNLWCLADEAYFHIHFNDFASTSIASLPGMKDRTCILITCGKAWSMTGWRMGFGIGPEKLIQLFGKMSTNFEGCSNHFVQWASMKCFTDPSCMEYTKQIVAELRRRRDVLHRRVNQIPGFRAPLPKSTFYMWVNCTEAFDMLKISNYEQFRQLVLKEAGVSFCTRQHFGDCLAGETQKYIRFAFSGINVKDIEASMDSLQKFMKKRAPFAKL